jgi:cellulose synthase/poly-beta-1,6-N-acetylglucosamine synthase-like glycosyltransferase
VLASVVYFLMSLVLFISLIRIKHSTTHATPSVSVIVSARNESAHITKCLTSLSRLNYPPEKLEFIIVNDRSTDNTGELIDRFIEQHSHFKAIHITNPHPFLSGKAGALSHAIQISRGEIIFVTDADCIVPEQWINQMIPHFDTNIGVVAGFTLIKSISRKFSLFEKIQAIDWFYLLTIASGAAGLGIPLSCVGNNFAFRKQAYSDVGGYEGVGYSLTEDFALLNSIRCLTDWQIRFPLLPDALVVTKPISSIFGFIRQRKRWATGALKVHPFGKLLIAISLLTSLVLIVSLLHLTLSWMMYTALLLFFSADMLVLGFTLTKTKKRRWLIYYPAFKIFHLLYLILLPILILLKPNIHWKGMDYTIRQ